MVKDGYYLCMCGKKVSEVTGTTTIIGPVFCRHCKRHHDVIIVNGEQLRANIGLPEDKSREGQLEAKRC